MTKKSTNTLLKEIGRHGFIWLSDLNPECRKEIDQLRAKEGKIIFTISKNSKGRLDRKITLA